MNSIIDKLDLFGKWIISLFQRKKRNITFSTGIKIGIDEIKTEDDVKNTMRMVYNKLIK